MLINNSPTVTKERSIDTYYLFSSTCCIVMGTHITLITYKNIKISYSCKVKAITVRIWSGKCSGRMKVLLNVFIGLLWQQTTYLAQPQSKFPTRPTVSKPYIARSDCAYVIEQCCSMAHALTVLPVFSQ
jgi:hypothetical protein